MQNLDTGTLRIILFIRLFKIRLNSPSSARVVKKLISANRVLISKKIKGNFFPEKVYGEIRIISKKKQTKLRVIKFKKISNYLLHYKSTGS